MSAQEIAFYQYGGWLVASDRSLEHLHSQRSDRWIKTKHTVEVEA